MDKEYQSVKFDFIFTNTCVIVFSSSADIGGITEVLQISASTLFKPQC